MIKILVNKGWSKNEIIYEMQRIFGNDVLILVRALDDDRSTLGKNIVPISTGLIFGGIFLLFKLRSIRKTRIM